MNVIFAVLNPFVARAEVAKNLKFDHHEVVETLEGVSHLIFDFPRSKIPLVLAEVPVVV